MSNRRDFIKKAALIGVTSHLAGDCFSSNETSVPKSFSSWEKIAEQFFSRSEKLINFNTGSAGIMPIPIYNSFVDNTKELATNAPYEVKGKHAQKIENALNGLASRIGASHEEISMVRNTTEGIGSILNKYPFKTGDEVIIANTAYPYPEYLIDRLVNKIGIKKVKITLEPVALTDEEIVDKFAEAISSNTKLIIATHVLHREGQIMPVKLICEMAGKQGVEVLLDAAHSLGQIPHNVRDINCDYYITSLHKWMYAPLGSGLIFMKRKHIPKIDPGFSYPLNLSSKIKKYDYTGTIAFQNAMTLPAVVEFDHAIGRAKKFERLLYLSDYLRKGLASINGIKFRGDAERSTGIVSFSLKDGTYQDIIDRYEHEFNIHVKKTGYYGVGYIRATLNLHLLEPDLDKFLHATEEIAKDL